MTVNASDFRLFTDWVAQPRRPIAADPRKRLQLHHAISATLVYDAGVPQPRTFKGNLDYSPGWEGGDPSDKTRFIVIPTKFQGSLIRVSGQVGFMTLILTLSNPAVVEISGSGVFGYTYAVWRTSEISNLGPPNPALPTIIQYHFGGEFDDYFDLFLSRDYHILRIT